MLGLLLDGAILCGIVMVVCKDESPDFWPAVGCALVTAVIGFAVSFGVVAATGSIIAAVVAASVVVGIAAAVALALVFSASPGKAALGGTIFMAYKLGISLLFAVVFAV